MSDDIYGEGPLTNEQAQRNYAVITAADTLKTQGKTAPLAIGDRQPGKVADIVDLADYIVTGRTYTVNQNRRDLEDFPPIVGHGLFGHGMLIPIDDIDQIPDFLRNVMQRDSEAEHPDLSPEALHDLLMLVEGEFETTVPSADWIRSKWPIEVQRQVAIWASAVHYAASDNDVAVPPIPDVLTAL